jgi:hypothetical protein
MPAMSIQTKKLVSQLLQTWALKGATKFGLLRLSNRELNTIFEEDRSNGASSGGSANQQTG